MNNQSCKYPIFFSYSRADELATNGYIGQFHKAFSQALAGHLTIEGLDLRPPFRDVDELNGRNGDLDTVLKQEIASSFALCVFLGRGYLKSHWCFREIQHFSALHKGKRDVMNARVWIFQLDDLNKEEDSLYRDRLQAAGAGELDTYLRQQLILPGNTNAKRPRIFMSEEVVFQETSEKIFQPLAKELTGKLTKAGLARPESRPAERDYDVLVLAPHQNLDDSCSQLLNGLQDHKNLRVLKRDELSEIPDADLKGIVSGAKLIVFPILTAEVPTKENTIPRIQRQFEACGSVLERTIFWVPTEAVRDNPPVPTMTVEGPPGIRNVSVTKLIKEIECRLGLDTQAGTTAQILVLVEQKDHNDFSWAPMVEDLKKHWQNLYPTQSQHVGLKAAGFVTHDFMNQTGVGVAGEACDGHAVIVFPDATPDMMLKKCWFISQFIPSWLAARMPLTPGLVVQKVGAATSGNLVNFWPLAHCSQIQEGEPPEELVGAFEVSSVGALKQFFKRIEKLRTSGPPPAS